jgi:hypothetical protein
MPVQRKSLDPGQHRLYVDPTPEQLRRRDTTSRIVACSCAVQRDHLVGHLICLEQNAGYVRSRAVRQAVA